MPLLPFIAGFYLIQPIFRPMISGLSGGGGIRTVSISDDPDTYGTVWYFDLANDFGTAPMRDPNTGKPFHFLDWLEYWADRTAGFRSWPQ